MSVVYLLQNISTVEIIRTVLNDLEVVIKV